MTAPRAREHNRAPSPPDRRPPRRGGRPSSQTASAAHRPAGFARLAGARQRLVRSARVLAAAALLTLSGALALPAPAQAQTGCTLNPGDIWCGVVTVGPYTIPGGQVVGYGFVDESTDTGALSDTEFSVGPNSYTIDEILVDATDDAFYVGLTSPLTDADAAKLVLHVGSASFAFGDVTPNSNDTYLWDADLDWSSESSVTVRLAQAQTACTLNPGDIWCGVVTVGPYTIPGGQVVGYGFVDESTDTGALSDTEFSVGPNSYTIDEILVDATDDAFYVGLTSPLTDADAAKLVLHVGSASFAFGDVTPNSNDTYLWDADLDWSSESTVTVRLREAATTNAAPSFTSSTTFKPAENQTTVGTVAASDSDMGDDITGYTLNGGADQALFAIVSTSGVLTFLTAPDYEVPQDADTDNAYLVEVQATSGTGDREQTATQTITVTVTDADEGQSGTVSIDDTAPMVGDALTASTADVDDPDGLPDPFVPTWQWYRTPAGGSETEIAGESSATYTVVEADLDAALTAKASWTDAGGFANTLASAPTSAVTATLPELSVADASATEGEDVTFTVTLSAAAAENVTVNWATSAETGDTATSGTDFTAASDTLTFMPGDTTQTVTVQTTADSTGEDNETFTVTLSSPSSNATLAADPTATGTIVDGDAPNAAPTAADGTVTTDEDTAYAFGASDFGFTDTDTDDELASVRVVTLPGSGTLAVSGAAVSADQEVAASDLEGNLTYTPAADGHGSGYASFTFRVSDGTDESAADYTMTIDVNAVNDAPSAGTVSIDDTAPMVGDELTASTADVVDPDGLPDPFEPTWQWYRTTGGGTEVLIPGATSATWTVVEADVGAALTAKASWTDLDGFTNTLASAATSAVTAPLPELGVADASATEGDDVTFTVTLSAAAVENVTADWATSVETGDTAVSGTDFTAANGTLVFGIGETEKIVVVQTISDDVTEVDETFTLTLSDPSGAVLGNATAAGTITNDDDSSADAGLSGLVVHHGSVEVKLSPDFAPATTSYTAAVEAGVGEITVTATRNDAGATIAWLDGAGVALDDADDATAGQQVSLAVGDNVVQVVVTAEDLIAARTYTLTANRPVAVEPPTVETVAVTSAPLLDADTYGRGETIEISVVFNEPVIATAETDFVLSVAGARRAPLLRGSGTRTLVFGYTVQTGDVDTDGVWIGDQDRTLVGDRNSNIQRGAITSVASALPADLAHDALGAGPGHKVDGSRDVTSTDATLSALVVSVGSSELMLSPFFTPAVTVYAASVANVVAEVTVTPTPAHDAATIEYFDGDAALLTDAGAAGGHQVEMVEGDNVIAVKVTAGDLVTIETYTVTVTRRVPDGAGVEGQFRLAPKTVEDYPNSTEGHLDGSTGRAEVFHAGRWGTVCSDGFSRPETSRFVEDLDTNGDPLGTYTYSDVDNNAPALVCQSMGYDTGEYASGFGQPGVPSQPSMPEMPYYSADDRYPVDGPLPIWLDDLTCAAGDADLERHPLPAPLAHCGYAGWGLHNCSHREDAGVRCWNVEDSAPAGVAEPLTAAFEGLPEAHDGETAFSFRLGFSEAVAVTPEAMRTRVLTVAGGAVTGAARVDGESGVWESTVTPDSREDLSIALAPTEDCEAEGAVCTSDGRALSVVPAQIVPGPGPETEPALTAAFEGLPEAHDGEEAFHFRVAFSEEIGIGFRSMRDDSFAVDGGEVTRARRVDRRHDLWRITVEPDGEGDVTVTLAAGRECAVSGAICTRGGDRRQLTNTPAATVAGPVDESAPVALTVDYVTSDVTARAGEDYEAASGTLTFATGERLKTVEVTVLDDAHDEGEETLTLTLSNPSGAYLADATATGTIENTDHMPKAWMVRFGRTVGSQVVDALNARLDGAGGSHVTVAGINLIGAPGLEPQAEDDDPFGLPEWAKDAEREPDAWTITGEDIRLRSAFHLSSGGDGTHGGGPAFTAWGRVATGGFRAEEDGGTMDGGVTTGLLGFDAEWERALAGVMLSQSSGDGSYRLDPAKGDDAGTVESSLTGVYPYARVDLNRQVSAWALAGIGSGELTLHQQGEKPMPTDISMRMGAVGVKGKVLDGTGASGVALNVKSDAMWVGTKSERTNDMVATEGDVTRVRLILQGERRFEVGNGATFTPSAEVGLRHDGGDAETGTGVEVGAGLRYTAGAVTVEAQARTLLAHEASGYENWGASGAIRVTPDASGRGLTLSIAPVWGRTGSAAERLWSAHDARALGEDSEFEADSRLAIDAGYGIGLTHRRGVLTPYAGLTLGDAGNRTVRTGTRWQVSPDATLGLEATRQASDAGEADNEVKLRAALRF